MSCVFEARHALLCAVHPHRKCFADSRTVLHCNINQCPSYCKPEEDSDLRTRLASGTT